MSATKKVTLRRLNAARRKYNAMPFGKPSSKEREANWIAYLELCDLIRRAPRTVTAKLVGIK